MTGLINVDTGQLLWALAICGIILGGIVWTVLTEDRR